MDSRFNGNHLDSRGGGGSGLSGKPAPSSRSSRQRDAPRLRPADHRNLLLPQQFAQCRESLPPGHLARSNQLAGSPEIIPPEILQFRLDHQIAAIPPTRLVQILSDSEGLAHDFEQIRRASLEGGAPDVNCDNHVHSGKRGYRNAIHDGAVDEQPPAVRNGHKQARKTATGASPSRKMTSSPVLRSAATIANGILSCSKARQCRAFDRNASIRSLVANPRRGNVQRAKLLQRTFRAAATISSVLQPLASPAATMLPMLVPATLSIAIWLSSNAFRTPMWARPRANPPPSARPRRSREAGCSIGAWEAGTR